MRVRVIALITTGLGISAVSLACGSDGAASATSGDETPTSPAAPSGSPAPPPRSETKPPADGGGAGDASTAADAGADATTSAPVSCASAPPAGAPTAAALPSYAGTCPAFAAAPAATTITSSGAQRQFIVYRPTTIAPGEHLPVVFLWHWLGGSAEKMGSVLDVQAAADQRRFVGVVPVPKGDATFRWPFEVTQSDARVEEEARFFDDMLACVAAALPVNKECVSSAGVSAGALFTSQLAVARSTRLSSIVSLSGGVGGVVRSWSTTPHRLPVLVLWGGSSDVYPSNLPIMNFETASKKLESSLDADGHFHLECVHNCGHAVPPFDPPPAGALQFDVLWRFVLDHPYWLAPGQSPYAKKALPAVYPTWCGEGTNGATPRPANAACP